MPLWSSRAKGSTATGRTSGHATAREWCKSRAHNRAYGRAYGRAIDRRSGCESGRASGRVNDWLALASSPTNGPAFAAQTIEWVSAWHLFRYHWRRWLRWIACPTTVLSPQRRRCWACENGPAGMHSRWFRSENRVRSQVAHNQSAVAIASLPWQYQSLSRQPGPGVAQQSATRQLASEEVPEEGELRRAQSGGAPSLCASDASYCRNGRAD